MPPSFPKAFSPYSGKFPEFWLLLFWILSACTLCAQLPSLPNLSHFFVSFPYALEIRKRFYILQRGGAILCVKFSRYSVYQKWDYLLIATHRWVNFPRKSRVSFNYKSTIITLNKEFEKAIEADNEYIRYNYD